MTIYFTMRRSTRSRRPDLPASEPRKTSPVLGRVDPVTATGSRSRRMAGSTPKAPSVVGDDAISILQQEEHLVLPRIGRQWAAVDEHHGRARAPILEVKARAVFRNDAIRCPFASSCQRVSFRIGRAAAGSCGMTDADGGNALRLRREAPSGVEFVDILNSVRMPLATARLFD